MANQFHFADSDIEIVQRLLGIVVKKYVRNTYLTRYERFLKAEARRCPCNQCINRNTCESECNVFKNYVARNHRN